MTNLTKETNNFNLVRLFACFQVLILHSRSFYNLDENTICSKILWLFPGVIIFFCISGFLIAKSFEFSTPQGFISKRISRIYPALIANITITSILLYYFGLLKFNLDLIKYLTAQLSIFQFYVPENIKHFGIGHPNGALWTISIELQFYLLFFIIAILTNWKTKSLAFKNSIILFLIVSSCTVNYLTNNYLIYESMTYKLLFNSIPYHFTFFGIGILLWINFKTISNLFINKLRYWFSAILLSIILIIINDIKISRYQFDSLSYLYLLLLLFFMFSFVFSNNRLSFKLLKNIDISYGTYIYHCLIINLFLQLKFEASFLPLIYVISIACGIISWYTIERKNLINKY